MPWLTRRVGRHLARGAGTPAFLALAALVVGVTGIPSFSSTEFQSCFGVPVSHSLGLFSDYTNVGTAVLHKALHDLVGLCHPEPSVPSPPCQAWPAETPSLTPRGWWSAQPQTEKTEKYGPWKKQSFPGGRAPSTGVPGRGSLFHLFLYHIKLFDTKLLSVG